MSDGHVHCWHASNLSSDPLRLVCCACGANSLRAYTGASLREALAASQLHTAVTGREHGPHQPKPDGYP